MIMTPTTAFRAPITGPRRWNRRPFTSRPTADSRRRSRERLAYWEEKRAKGSRQTEPTQGISTMYQSNEPAAYWHDQLFEWGPQVLFAHPYPCRHPFRRQGGAVGRSPRRSTECRSETPPQVGGDCVGTELGRLAYWMVWLVGLIAALQPLGLSGVLTPVTALTNEVFAFLPRLIGAGLFFFAGLILGAHRPPCRRGGTRRAQPRAAARPRRGQYRRRSRWRSTRPASRPKAPPRRAARSPRPSASPFRQSSSSLPRSRALQILQISAISDPATAMLNTIALAIPQVIAALLILAIAFLIGRWVKTLVETVLPSLGFDRTVQALGMMPAGANPSRIVGTIAMTAVLICGIDGGGEAGWTETPPRPCCSRSPSLAAKSSSAR